MYVYVKDYIKMDNKRIFTIQINGITESVSAVASLNKQLNELEQRIKDLDKSTVSVGTSGGGGTSRGGGSKSSSLSEEEKLAKQIENIDEKRVAYSKELYQNYLAAKDVLKETVNDQKQLAAAERLQADSYSNTMAGLKEKLADLKSVHFTTDMSSDEFLKQTQEINAVNQKLKELEQEYGVYSRNVGNYANGVAEGLQKLKINIGDTTKEFDNAKQALKELKKERDTLSVKKDMGLISEEEAKRLESLIPVVAELQSSIQDAGKPMDSLMDSMQSVVALAQTSKGFSAFFGVDDSDIQKSIQKLVALQNAMQGLQTIQKQLQSGEGIASWLTKGNDAIDKLVKSIFGVEKASKAATVASKSLGIALKAIGIGALIAGVTALISLLETWTNRQNEAAEAAEEAAEKVRKSVEEQRQTFVNASAQYENTASRLSHLRSEYLTTNDELKKTSILKEASKEFKNLGMSVRSVTDAQNILVKQGDKVIEMIRLQGDAAALAALRMEAFKKSFNILMENGYDARSASILAGNSGLVTALDEQLDTVNQKIGQFQKELGIKTKEAGTKQGKTIQEVEKELTRLRIDQMKEGLNKTIKQLEEERRQKIAKIKSDGKMVGELTLETNKLYDQKIEDAKKKHAENVEKIYKDMWKNIQDQAISNAQRELELIENQIEQERRTNEVGSGRYVNDKGIGSYGIQGKEQLSRSTQKALGIASTRNTQFMADMKDYIDLLRKASVAEDTYKTNKLRFDEIIASGAKLSDEELGKLNMQLDKSMNNWLGAASDLSAAEAKLKKLYGEKDFNETKEELLSESYSSSLSRQIEQRLAFTELYWTERLKIEGDAAQKVYDQQSKIENDSFAKISGETWANYQKQLELADKYYQERLELAKVYESSGNTVDASIERKEAEAEYKKASNAAYYNYKKQEELDQEEHENNLLKIEQNRLDKSKAANAEYYQDITQEMRDAQTAIAELESKQPVMNAWGFTNWNKTDANNKNLLDAYTKQAEKLSNIRKQLQKDYSQGFIDKDVYDSIMRGFDALAAGIGEKMDKVKQEMSLGNKIGTIIQEAQQYINTIGNAFSTVLNAVWDAQDAAYNKMMDELDKSIEEVQKRYDKMDELAEEHKNNIEDIESLIAQAQGDAREHLLERYQAEIQAQRDAIRERRKAEKEEEKLEAKKEREEQKQREREHDRAVTQAIISAALATANALATTPFIPTGLAMGTLAAALGAAQVAIIKSQKYGDGGVIEGKSHAAGGVKVLGGRAEVEGGEYITNKVTTAKNVELLEYINTKKRRVNLDDLIEFYGNPVRKNIQAVRTRFADGGELPTLSNNISIGNGLATAMQEYANRPTVVSVVDIIDKTQKVNNVKVMAGLDV